MPRIKRRHVVGAIAHVIVRFVDGLYVMDDVDGAREQYLLRLDRAIGASDWTLCWYALMSTHVHLGVICGEEPLETWAKRLHCGWANWINRTGRQLGRRTRGPVLADRPQTLLVPDPRAAHLGAYIHNNPVRAQVVRSPEDSTWSSHRAYLGIARPIAALDVERGLAFYGCTAAPEGRQRFHEFVCDRRFNPRDPDLSGRTAREVRRACRIVHGRTAELMTPKLADDRRAHFDVDVPSSRYVRYTGAADAFLARASCLLEVDRTMLPGPGRNRARARLRTMIVLAWRLLGRTNIEICSALEISQSAACNILARATLADHQAAASLVRTLR